MTEVELRRHLKKHRAEPVVEYTLLTLDLLKRKSFQKNPALRPRGLRNLQAFAAKCAAGPH